MGKPLGNGHPLGAVVTTPQVAASFLTGMEYFNTFGGNPVSAAVGQAVLDVLTDEKLLDNAKNVGDYVVAGLERLQKKHALIGDVRGRGLFFAVELVTDPKTRNPAPQQTKQIINRMRDRGVLISRIGPHDNILKIRPPMPFSKEHADLLLTTLDDVLSAL
jgi:4-aminobutyrate aminotransferase-like enzyme